jgi:heme exporter protein C
MTRNDVAPGWLLALSGLAVLAVIAAQVYGLLYTPPAEDYRASVKIMYIHMPVVWSAFLAIMVVLGASVVYLVTRWEGADLLAASAAELGTLFTGLTIVVGSIWGRWAWGIWWTWDARLTSVAILFMIFVGYLSLRAFTEDPEQRAAWSAGVGIFGALNIPIVYMSVRWWRTLHQVQSTPASVAPEFSRAMTANTAAFVLLMLALLVWRYRIAVRQRTAEALREARLLARSEEAAGMGGARP